MKDEEGGCHWVDEPDDAQKECRQPIIKTRRIKPLHLEAEAEFSGECAFPEMLKSFLRDAEIGQRVVGDFEIQEGVEMYNQLPVHIEFQIYDLSEEAELAAIALDILAHFDKPSWGVRNAI